jgi:hypothetical protein
MYSVSRNDVKKLAAQIEVLARKVQEGLDGNGDFLTNANELVRNSTTMVFALGEVYASEQNSKATKSLKNMNRVYKRDSRGRFARA